MKTDVRVGDCMTRGVVTARIDASVVEIAKTLKKNEVGSVIVTQEGKMRGVITERDIAYKIVAEGKDPRKTTAKDVMSSPVTTIGADKNIEDAAMLLKQKDIKRLPVIDEKGKLVGIVTESDLLSVYPGLLEVLQEDADIHSFHPTEVFTGVCERCGNYSETLRRSAGKVMCEECTEEEEV